jgi:GGDEF domain-containing protein
MYQASKHSGPVISPTNQPLSALAGQRTHSGTFSIRSRIYTSAGIIILLLLVIAVINLIVTKNYYRHTDDQATYQRLGDKIQAIETHLAFLQQIIDHIAVQPTTQNILESRDGVAAQAWALQIRSFLPQALGVAVLDHDGKIFGTPLGHDNEQAISAQCLADLAQISQGAAVVKPPIHREPGYAPHFDLTAPVLDATKNNIGLLYISFNLATLQTSLQNATGNGQRLELSNKRGIPIAWQNRLDLPNEIRQASLGVRGTDWQLTLIEAANRWPPGLLGLSLFNISAFLLIIGIIAFLARLTLRSLKIDFTQVKGLLSNLAEGTDLAEEQLTPQLRETAEILPAISHIRHNLDKKQQLLEHQCLSDPLTNLANQRQFNLDFARAYDFARRGNPVCVALLQLAPSEHLNTLQIEQILKIFAKALRKHTRKVDIIARLDEDRFALLMFGMKTDGVRPCLERQQQNFRDSQARHPAFTENDLYSSLDCSYTLIHPHRDSNATEVFTRTEAALVEARASTEHSIIKI